MASLRQRKQETPDDGNRSSSSSNEVDSARVFAAAAAASAASSTGEPGVHPATYSVPRFFPFLLLFLFFFISFSFLSTGTPFYGYTAASLRSDLTDLTVPTLRVARRWLNLAKVKLQELVGLRKKLDATAESQRGYGGVTKRKQKKKQSSPTSSSTSSTPSDSSTPVPGQAPPSGAGAASGSSESDDALLDIRPPAERDPKELHLTLDQLADFTGEDGGTVLLAVYGRIFDVSAGRQHYGPEGGYRSMAGKDVSRAFATNCYNNQQLHDLRGLTREQRKSIDGWYKFYDEHPNYQAVGWVELPHIPDDAPLPNDKC